ncbi:MAG: GAF domain-containing protein, partial [Anaerolineae bacterium]|nr:GAF domain-containing protein [Anaerolineae bacterium]
MKPAPIPKNETERLAVLQRLNLLDTEPEERFDRLVRLAKAIFQVPVAAVTLVDADRQWFKACIGLPVTETSRDIAFSSHAINGDNPLVVSDTHLDERFANNPLVVEEPHVRFYAGQPLKSIDDHNIGTLCLIDFVPRTLSDAELVLLIDLAEVIERETNYQEVDLLRQRLVQSNQRLKQEALERIETEKTLREIQTQLTEAQQIGRLGAWSWDTVKDEVKWNDTLHEIFDVPLGSPVDAARYTETIHPDDRAASWHIIQSAMEMGET